MDVPMGLPEGIPDTVQITAPLSGHPLKVLGRGMNGRSIFPIFPIFFFEDSELKEWYSFVFALWWVFIVIRASILNFSINHRYTYFDTDVNPNCDKNDLILAAKVYSADLQLWYYIVLFWGLQTQCP